MQKLLLMPVQERSGTGLPVMRSTAVPAKVHVRAFSSRVRKLFVPTEVARLKRRTVVWEMKASSQTANWTEEILCGIERGVPGDNVDLQVLLLLPE